MKYQTLWLGIFMLLLGFVVTSCGSTKGVLTTRKAEKLLVKSWQVKDMVLPEELAAQIPAEMQETLKTTFQKIYFEFKSNKSCASHDPDGNVKKGTWSISSDAKTLTIKDDETGKDEVCDLITLNSNDLVIRFNADGSSITLKLSPKK